MIWLAPPPVKKLGTLDELFAGAIEKSEKFGKLYSWVSQRLCCEFVNAGEIVEYDLADGIHLGATGHAAFGRYLASWLRSHFEGAQS